MAIWAGVFGIGRMCGVFVRLSVCAVRLGLCYAALSCVAYARAMGELCPLRWHGHTPDAENPRLLSEPGVR